MDNGTTEAMIRQFLKLERRVQTLERALSRLQERHKYWHMDWVPKERVKDQAIAVIDEEIAFWNECDYPLGCSALPLKHARKRIIEEVER